LWSLVLRDSELRINALARASSNCKQQTHPLVREDYDRRCSIEKKILAVSLKGLSAKTNLLAVNCQL
jgi:hypothetical protein